MHLSKQAIPCACRLKLRSWRHSRSLAELAVLLAQVTEHPQDLLSKELDISSSTKHGSLRASLRSILSERVSKSRSKSWSVCLEASTRSERSPSRSG